MPNASESEIRKQTALFVGRLATRLARAYPRKQFVVIASLGDSPVVRFHESRSGQAWLAENLEGHESEALMRLTFPY
jgi:hypothetical protein